MKTSLIAATALVIAGLSTGAHAQLPTAGLSGALVPFAAEHRHDIRPADTEPIHFSGRYRRHVHRHCLPRRRIRARLRRRGYTDLKLLDRYRHVVVLKARRKNGRRFVLRVNRCNGHVIAVRPAKRRWGRGLGRHRGHDHRWDWRFRHTYEAEF